jgi:hypothetical protein
MSLIMIRRIEEDASDFTPTMRDELLRLKALIASGQPGDGFPWAVYHDLLKRERPSMAERRYIRRHDSEGSMNGAGTEPNNGKFGPPQEDGFPPAISEIEIPTGSPALKPPTLAQPKTPATKAGEAPSLQSLCKAENDKRRDELANRIDEIWEKVKNNTQKSDYATACAAVYKLAVWLGVVHKETKSRAWKAMLLERYKVSVTEAVGKYQFDNPPKSEVFKLAVREAYNYAKLNLAPARQKKLPSIYQ